MKIAITGASGFLGTHLRKSLDQHNISYSVLNRKKHNLLDPATLRDFVLKKDVIIHLAGKNRDSSLLDMIKVNVLGVKGLLDAISCYSPNTKLIFSSSFLSYFEDNIYGVTKKIAEELIEKFSCNYPIKSVILRFANVYGPSCKPFGNSVIATFCHLAKRKQKLTIHGDGTQKRDFLYVKDAVDAIVKSISFKPKKTEIFDICTGKLSSLNKIIDIIEIYTPYKLRVSYNKNILVRNKVTKKSYSKAEKLINWKPTINLKRGLRELLVFN